jgi:hypothetical protein
MPDELSIDRLSELVGDRAASEDPIEQLAAAVLVARETRCLADALLDRYVADARERGRPWSEVGATLGVSKQAAQQRFAPAGIPMNQVWSGVALADRIAASKHFDADARGVLELAQRRAREMGHRYLDTEHLLLALIEDPGLAGAALTGLGIDSAQVSEQIRSIIGLGDSSETAWLGSTPRTKRVLEAAGREARRLGHGRGIAAPVYILLALSAREDGVAAKILRALDVTDDRLRGRLRELLAGEAPEFAAQIRQSPRRRRRI